MTAKQLPMITVFFSVILFVFFLLSYLTSTRTVKEHMYRLRRKLFEAPVKIESARGEGYRLTAVSDKEPALI